MFQTVSAIEISRCFINSKTEFIFYFNLCLFCHAHILPYKVRSEVVGWLGYDETAHPNIVFVFPVAG